MCAFYPPQHSTASAAVPIFTTRCASTFSTGLSSTALLSTQTPSLSGGGNPFSFFTATQHPRATVADVTASGAQTPERPSTPTLATLEDSAALLLNAEAGKPKSDGRSATHCSSLSRSQSSFAISSASELNGSAASTRAPSPIPQVKLCDQNPFLHVVASSAAPVATPVPLTTAPSLSLHDTICGAKALFRRLAQRDSASAPVHADDVIELFLALPAPWFTAGALVVALCLVNRYTARFPAWYATNQSACENDARRLREEKRCGQTLNLQSAGRTLLAALQTATKFYADTTYKNESLCAVWNDQRKVLLAQGGAAASTSSIRTVLAASRLAASEWRLMEELDFSAWVEADEYNACLSAIVDLV